MEPRITKHDNKLHLSYHLPHRIQCSHIYPLPAPNGSTILIYGHSRGLRLIWRGGRRHKDALSGEQDAAQTHEHGNVATGNTSKGSNHMDEQTRRLTKAGDLYEDNEDELDADRPFPRVVRDVDIDLDSQILSMATPTIPLGHTHLPRFFRHYAPVAVSLSDGKIVVLEIPLAPPRSEELHEYVANIKRTAVTLRDQVEGVPSLALKVVDDAGDAAVDKPNDHNMTLFAAVLTSNLDIWQLRIHKNHLTRSTDHSPAHIRLPFPGHRMSVNLSSKYHWLSLCDDSGAVRLYDPLINGSPSDEHHDNGTGQWAASYLAPYHTPREQVIPARRKRILDAQWVLSGRGILALLEDGEWGIWDTTGTSQPGKSVGDFTIGGFLDTMTTTESAGVGKQRKGAAKLAPMTPNTRKSKADSLFAGPPKTRRAALGGGISISSAKTRSGQTDESVALWYGNDIFTIPSMHAFWQRSLNAGSGLGSLYAPGLTHLSFINLMNEDITSISQFPAQGNGNSLGQMNTARDLLISTEHRLIIVQSARSPTRATSLFEPKKAAEPATSQDQRMLDAGELNLDGMDRMLDNMSGEGRTRKVGFASQ